MITLQDKGVHALEWESNVWKKEMHGKIKLYQGLAVLYSWGNSSHDDLLDK